MTNLSTTTTSFEVLTTPTNATTHRRVLHLIVDSDAPAVTPTDASVGDIHGVFAMPATELMTIRDKQSVPKHLLGQWMATAVCGNDVLSSCTYSAAVVALQAGIMAPVAFCLVSFVLFVYRFVYEEVVTAVPLNGGAYNALLNTTSKRFAAVAACLSTLCYTATAVISSTSAVNYMTILVPSLNVVWTSVGVLAVFAFLMLIGIKESAVVATAMFILHMATLTILSIACLIYTIQHPDILTNNYTNATYPDVNYMGTTLKGDFWTALFFGFGAAMLGVTGFETSANFVEEQQPGVFRKTMRNMWSITSVFNILLAVLCFGVLKMDGPDGIVANSNYALAQLGLVSAGTWAQYLVVIDSFIVLSGAVLTSFVGINGLMRRLASDRVIPAFFIQTNKWRGTCHWIILAFFVIASSLVVVLNANQTQMAGVYTYSFLSMMFLFSTGCVLLKLKRRDIPRDLHAPWWCIVCGMTLVIVGFLANLLGNPQTLMYFVCYFLFVLLVVFGMLERVFLLRALVVLTNLLCVTTKTRPSPEDVLDDDVLDASTPDSSSQVAKSLNDNVYGNALSLERETGKVSGLWRTIRAIKNAPVVFFIKRADLTTLNKAILYVRANEATHYIWFVHFYTEPTPDAMET
ncbi:hypothetical protein As57867_004593, partial [Aphanomyces stellatus]